MSPCLETKQNLAKQQCFAAECHLSKSEPENRGLGFTHRRVPWRAKESSQPDSQHLESFDFLFYQIWIINMAPKVTEGTNVIKSSNGVYPSR